MDYCIIIPDFRGVGGGQFYAFRRYKYLKMMGKDPFFVIGENNNKLSFDEKQIPVYYDSEILKYSFDVSRKQRNISYVKFTEFTQNQEVLVIESTDPMAATWGEIFAKKWNSKHILYSLVEPPLHKGLQNRLLLNLIKFKQNQGNLIGLSSKSLFKMLGKELSEKDNSYVNISYDTNELSYSAKLKICENLDKDAFVIGTVSRLEKEYVESLIEDSIFTAKKSKNQKIVLLIIGDSIDINQKDRLIKKYKDFEVIPKNLNVIFLGYIFPLPASYFGCIDIFVGMGTAAVSSISQSCATIVVDPYLNLSSGVFGLDTNNFAYSENGKQYTIGQSLEYLLNNPDIITKAQEKGIQLYNTEFTTEICMSKLDAYIDKSKEGNYWSYSKYSMSYLIRSIYRNRNKAPFKEINRVRHLLHGRKLKKI